jgi:hypothetical protein
VSFVVKALNPRQISTLTARDYLLIVAIRYR